MSTPTFVSAEQISAWARSRMSCKAFAAGHSLSAAELQALKDLLRLAPSSINSQAWHFVIASSQQGRAQVAQGMAAPHFQYNAEKVQNAAAAVVLCVQRDLPDGHMAGVLVAEAEAGRFATPQMQAQRLATCENFIAMHRQAGDVGPWLQSQAYIALGQTLLGLHAMGLNACPIEGFDAAQMDAALGLPAQGLRSVVCLAVGRRSDADFNASLPKSRLPEAQVISVI